MNKINASVLVVDDDKDILTSLSLYLKHHFQEVNCTQNPKELASLLKDHPYDCVILDMNFRKGVNNGKEGLYWLNFIKETKPETTVILLTAYGNLDLAVEALKIGAADFMVKPWKNEKLLSTLLRSLEIQKSKKEIIRLKTVNLHLSKELNQEQINFKTHSSKMQEVLAVCEKVAQTDANILILGENGTGKEELAKYIHNSSPRKEHSFIKVDLGAIPSNLIESELLGHTKGSFTDAKTNKTGRFELAQKGSLFLDEIGNLAFQDQSKILSVLQNRKYRAVGSNVEIDLDFRLICATNSSIGEMIDDQKFRQDLYYRINTVELKIPALRERQEDIAHLSFMFLNKYNQQYRKPKLTFTRKAIKKLEAHHWPGNIRELMHAIERSVVLNDKEINEDAFPFTPSTSQMSELILPSLKLEEVEKFCIAQALGKHNGNISHTALELEITRNTLYRKMEKYGL